MQNDIQYIIFDMDGVIIDSEQQHAIANITALEHLNVHITKEYAYSFIGSTLHHTMETIKSTYHINESVEKMIELANQETKKLIQKDGYQPIHGTLELIKKLKDMGYMLAIASSSEYDTIRKVTETLSITSYFTTIVSRTQVQNPKPSPDIFIKTMEVLNATPVECIVIEDSTLGVKAAKKAGCICIGFCNPGSVHQDLSLADYQVTEMADCLSIISCRPNLTQDVSSTVGQEKLHILP